MLYQDFHKAMSLQACFSSNQVYAWRPGFDKNNLGRWVKKGLLIKLRNGYYTFPQNIDEPNFAYFLATRMYRPSYISLHSSLSFYGLIPESVIQVTCVSTLKTNTFRNIFGEFSYRTIKPRGFFGYNHLPSAKGRIVYMAKPEKALLDLLYLYPFYKSDNDFKVLRFDEYFLEEKLNIEQLMAYTVKFKNVALEKRVRTFLNTYNL